MWVFGPASPPSYTAASIEIIIARLQTAKGRTMRRGARLLLPGDGALAPCPVTAGARNAQRSGEPKARYQPDVATTPGFDAMGGANRRGGACRSCHAVGRAPRHFRPARKAVSCNARHARRPGALPEFRPPSGRLPIFWGCGAHVGPGRPAVIDFSKIAQSQMPPICSRPISPFETGPTRTCGNAASAATVNHSFLIGGQAPTKGARRLVRSNSS